MEHKVCDVELERLLIERTIWRKHPKRSCLEIFLT